MSRLAAVLFCLFLSVPARAQATTHLRYAAYWGGLHAADFALSLDGEESARTDWFRLETRGFLDLLIRLEVEATSRKNAKGPETYHVRYRNRRRSRAIEIDFDEGAPAHTSTQTGTPDGPWEDLRQDEETDEDVPPDMRRDVLDPLAALVAALDGLRRHYQEGGADRFTLKVFDGRRRFDLDAEVLPPTERAFLGKRHATYRLRLSTKPLAGFNRTHRMLWDGSVFDLFVSRDGRFLPLQIDAVGPGPIIHLVEECPDRCALPRPE